MSNLTVEIETDVDKLEESFVLRKEVFVQEQGVPKDLELDDKEDKSIHFLLKKDDELAATCRLRVIDDFAKLERMVVKKEYREQGLGSRLITEVEEFIKNKELNKIKIHAQIKAKSFYQKNGFKQSSDDIFTEAGIKHIKMDKKV